MTTQTPYPPSAIHSAWNTYQQKQGGTLADFLRLLNSELGTNHKSGRLYDWLTTNRPTPAPVHHWAAAYALQDVLRQHLNHTKKISAAQASAIIESLS